MMARSARIHSIRVLRGDRHPVLALDPQREQAGRELEDLVLGLGPGQGDPALALQVAEGFLGRGGGDLLQQHRPHRCRPLGQQCCLGHIPRVTNGGQKNQASRSRMIAIPWPPPTHMVSSPSDDVPICIALTAWS